MSRKRRAPKKIPVVDPKYKSTIIPKLINNIIKLKRKLNKESNIKKVLNKTGNEINKLQNVKIEYLELRNIKNLKISNKLKNFVVKEMKKSKILINLFCLILISVPNSLLVF